MIVGKWGKTQKVKTIINRRIQAFIVPGRQLLFIFLHAFDFHFFIDVFKESKFTQGMDFV